MTTQRPPTRTLSPRTQTLSVRELEAQEQTQAREQRHEAKVERREQKARRRETRRIESRMRQLEVEIQRAPRPRRLARGTPLPRPAPRAGLGLPARLIYFAVLGFPLGMAWVLVGVALCLSLIGLPLGLWMLRHSHRIFFLW